MYKVLPCPPIVHLLFTHSSCKITVFSIHITVFLIIFVITIIIHHQLTAHIENTYVFLSVLSTRLHSSGAKTVASHILYQAIVAIQCIWQATNLFDANDVKEATFLVLPTVNWDLFGRLVSSNPQLCDPCFCVLFLAEWPVSPPIYAEYRVPNPYNIS